MPEAQKGRAARAAWERAKALIADPSYKLVLLDELNIVLRYDYLPLEEVIEAGDRALLFTQFAEWGHLLKAWLERRYRQEVPFLHGGTSKKGFSKTFGVSGLYSSN